MISRELQMKEIYGRKCKGNCFPLDLFDLLRFLYIFFRNTFRNSSRCSSTNSFGNFSQTLPGIHFEIPADILQWLIKGISPENSTLLPLVIYIGITLKISPTAVPGFPPDFFLQVFKQIVNDLFRFFF